MSNDYPNNFYVVLCEGESEDAYIHELNKFLRENSIPLAFSSINIGGGNFRLVVKEYKNCVKNNRKKDNILVFIDYDIYKRESSKDRVLFENRDKRQFPDEVFKFNYMNFEDFLALHTDDNTIKSFNDACKSRKHNISPLSENEYLPLFLSNVFPGYQKGNLPFDSITVERLKNLFKNNQDSSIMFKSDFAVFLEQNIKIN